MAKFATLILAALSVLAICQAQELDINYGGWKSWLESSSLTPKQRETYDKIISTVSLMVDLNNDYNRFQEFDQAVSSLISKSAQVEHNIVRSFGSVRPTTAPTTQAADFLRTLQQNLEANPELDNLSQEYVSDFAKTVIAPILDGLRPQSPLNRGTSISKVIASIGNNDPRQTNKLIQAEKDRFETQFQRSFDFLYDYTYGSDNQELKDGWEELQNMFIRNELAGPLYKVSVENFGKQLTDDELFLAVQKYNPNPEKLAPWDYTGYE